MCRHTTTAALIGLLVLPTALAAESKDAPSRLVLDDFESDPKGWTYIPGWEFPGAKGGLALDKAVSPSYMYVDYVRAYAKQRQQSNGVRP